MTNEIFIYGEITDYQGDDVDQMGGVNPKHVLNRLNQITEDEVIVRINSNGGSVDAGFAIYDILRNSGKKVTTQIEGQCYSIASVIALAGDERRATSNSQFLIHNPWTMAMGDSVEIDKTAKVLAKAEQKLAKFYAERTGLISYEVALDEMAKDTFMDLDQAMKYGFINSIIDTVKAVAKYTPMSKDKETEKPKAELPDGFLDKIVALFQKDKATVKALVLKSADDTDVDFFELEEGQDPTIGDKATVGGEDAEGEIVMADGRTFAFTASELSAITEAADDGEGSEGEDELAALQAENAELKSAIAELQNSVKDNATVMAGYSDIMNGLKDLIPDVVVDDKKNTKPNESATEGSVFGGAFKKA